MSATSSVSTSGVLVTMMPRRAAAFGVDMVVADAAGRENLELREAVEEGVVETFVALARRDATDFVRHLLELRLLLGAREGPIDGEGLVEPIRCLVRKRAGQQNIDRLGH